MLIGSAAQLLAGPLTALLGARKRLVVIGATLQAFSMLGLYLIAQHGVRALLPLLAVESVYFACALIVGPPWGSWMATLTAGRQRERYFARRGALVQVALLVAFVGAGFVLQRAGGETAPSCTRSRCCTCARSAFARSARACSRCSPTSSAARAACARACTRSATAAQHRGLPRRRSTSRR